MRNFIAIVSVLLSTVGLAHAANPITMVTYFPVPYASYNRVDVGGNANAQLDIGLLSGSSQLTLGSTGISGHVGLEVQNGTNLDAGTVSISSTTFFITGDNGINFPKYASVSDATPPQLKLKNADIGNFYGNTLKATNVSTPQMMLFDKTFPAGNSTGMSNDKICKESFQWKKLKLGKGNTEALYLMCGTEMECIPGNEQTQNCGCKNAGTQKKVCDSSGKWGNWSSCTKPAECPKEYHWVHGYGDYESYTYSNISSLQYVGGGSYDSAIPYLVDQFGQCYQYTGSNWWDENNRGNCPIGIKDNDPCTPSHPGADTRCYICSVPLHNGGGKCSISGKCPYIVNAPRGYSEWQNWIKNSQNNPLTFKLYKDHWVCSEKH